MKEWKECVECGGIYYREENVAQWQWEQRKYCSSQCSGKAGARRAKELREEASMEGGESGAVRLAGELPMPELAGEVQPLKPPDTGLAIRDAQVEALLEAAAEATSSRRGIERELKVIRVGPNPRMVICEYWELAERRKCVVNVGLAKKFVKGMRFKMFEPVSELEYQRPWVYRGPAPRRRGWW